MGAISLIKKYLLLLSSKERTLFYELCWFIQRTKYCICQVRVPNYEDVFHNRGLFSFHSLYLLSCYHFSQYQVCYKMNHSWIVLSLLKFWFFESTVFSKGPLCLSSWVVYGRFKDCVGIDTGKHLGRTSHQ